MVAPTEPASQLRTDAESELSRSPPNAKSFQPSEKLLHELQVHKIELETQNESLRNAQIELEESRNRYAELYDFAPVGYLTLDAGGRITEINLTGATLLGIDRKQLVGSDFLSYVSAAEQNKWRTWFQNSACQEGKLNLDLSLCRHDAGSFVASLQCRALRSDQGTPILRIAVSDITQRRQTEKAVKESETRFRVMADAAPVLIWMSGIDKGCIWFNQQWLDFTGRSMAQELGNGWADSVHGDDLDRCLRIYGTAFDRREPFEMEYRLRRADGKYCWVLDSGIPRYDIDREFLGYLGTCIDVTQLHDLNSQLEAYTVEQDHRLRELAGELTRAEQLERDRLYELLHDNMQPLLVAVRLSLSSLGPRSNVDDCLRIATEATAHISSVIHVARTLSLQLSPPLIRERGLMPALESLCHWVKEHYALDVALSGAPDKEPEDVAIRLVCFNAVRELLLNVAKHAKVNRATVVMRLADQNTLQISVTDRGSGFSPTAVGSGSGLSSIERRLSMFGGSLEIDSQPGQGTDARISLPLRMSQPDLTTHDGADRRKHPWQDDAQNTDRG